MGIRKEMVFGRYTPVSLMCDNIVRAEQAVTLLKSFSSKPKRALALVEST